MSDPLEKRIARLEKLLLPDVVKTHTKSAKWIREPTKLSINRCWPNGDKVITADEEQCEIFLWRFGKGNKPEVAARMNRGITLYAKYLPIYKDILAMMEKMQKELEQEGIVEKLKP